MYGDYPPARIEYARPNAYNTAASRLRRQYPFAYDPAGTPTWVVSRPVGNKSAILGRRAMDSCSSASADTPASTCGIRPASTGRRHSDWPQSRPALHPHVIYLLGMRRLGMDLAANRAE
jgi:hypothetical protein